MEQQVPQISIGQLSICLNINIPDNNLRKQHENMISSFKLQPKYSQYLLEIACNSKSEYSQEVQLNAAIQLKNYITENWRFSKDPEENKNYLFEDDEEIIIIPDEDKSYVLTNIIDAIIYIVDKENLKVLKQFNQAFKKIVRFNYINKAKALYDSKILQCLSCENNQKTVYAGIDLMHQISKSFEFEEKKDKIYYYDLAEKANPYLIRIIHSCNDLNNPIQAQFTYKILRIFFRSFQGPLSVFLISSNVYEEWSNIAVTVLQNPISEENVKLKNDGKNIFRKLKRICYQIITRVFKKYSDQTCENEEKVFKKLLIEKYSLIYYQAYKNIYMNIDNYKYFIDDNCMNFMYQFFISLMEHHKFSDDIAELFVKDDKFKFQLVKDAMMSKDDIEQWLNEPKSYISKQGDDVLFAFSKKYTTSKMFGALLEYRNKENRKLTKECKKKKDNSLLPVPTFYNHFISFLFKYIEKIRPLQIEENNNMQKNNYQLSSYEKIENNLIKESLMFLIQTNGENVDKYSSDQIDILVQNFILPEFDSPFGIMREKACIFVTRFQKHEYKDPQIAIEITKKICNLINSDKCLPVRIKGVVAASAMLNYPNAKVLLKENITTLLQIYLKLMEETDKEEIMGSLQQIINEFKQESRAYITELSDYITKYFIKITQKNEDDGEKLLDTSSMISNILNTFLDIIRYFKNDKEVYPKLEIFVKILLNYCFRDDNIVDRIEEGLEILEEIVKYSDDLSPNLWEYFPIIVNSIIGTEDDIKSFKQTYPDQIFEGSGFESISQISSIICGYIINNPKKFLTEKDKNGKDYTLYTLELVERVVVLCEKNDSYTEVKYVFNILRIILNTYRGQIDNIFSRILMIIKNKYSTKNKVYKDELRCLFSVCMIYDSQKTIQFLINESIAEKIFNFWFTDIDKLTGINSIKYYIIAITYLISIDPEKQNKSIINEMKGIIENLMLLIEKYNSLDKEEDDEEEEFEEVSDDDDEDGKKKNDFKFFEGEEDEEIDSEWGDDEDYVEIYGNKLNDIDKKNPVLFFREFLEALSKSSNQNYYNLIIGLIGDKVDKLKSAFTNMEKREKEKIECYKNKDS